MEEVVGRSRVSLRNSLLMAGISGGTMRKTSLQDLTACKSPSNPDQNLEEHLAYIKTLARIEVSRNKVYSEMMVLEADELAQNACIKFWLGCQKRFIAHPRAYIKYIVHSEFVDMIRRGKVTIPLCIDDEGELGCDLALEVDKRTQDTFDECEQKAEIVDQLDRIAQAVQRLPTCQQRAMICSLKDWVDDVDLLVDVFKQHGVNIEMVYWPEDRQQRQRIKASLSAARRKLHFLKDMF